MDAGLRPMIERSANEIFATVVKAGRAAGLPLAQITQFADFLSRCADDQTLSEAVALLTQPTALPQVSVADDQVTIAEAHPLRDLPTAQDALAAGVPMVILRDCLWAGTANLYAEHLGLNAEVRGTDIHLTKSPPPKPRPPQRAHISNNLWNALNRLAAETYVPDTEQSRLNGAGAGLSDND